MNGVAIGGISAVCPNCSATKIIGPSELGQGIECWECGTEFHVLRHRRRKRISRAPRTENLMPWAAWAAWDAWDAWDGWDGWTPRPTRRENEGAMVLIILLLGLAALGAILAANWEEVTEDLSKFQEWSLPEGVANPTAATDPEDFSR